MGRAGVVFVVIALTVCAAVPATAAAATTPTRIDVGVLLPDTTTAPRWASQDAPSLRAALERRGLRATVVNAHGSAATQRAQARAALERGAKVLILAGVLSSAGTASSQGNVIMQAAHRRGAKVIDYDRFTPGGNADYYVSYDNARVGILQGRGIISCLRAAGAQSPVVAQLNGAPIFEQGYAGELNPLFGSGLFVKGPSQYVPGWDPARAKTIFTSMLAGATGGIDAVVAGNDSIAAAVISVRHARGLRKIPVAGQDATVQGVHNLLSGDQCMTVLKAPAAEAAAAAGVARKLVRGQKVTSDTTFNEQVGGRRVPATLLRPVSVTRATIGRVLDAKALTRKQICSGRYAALCRSAGV